MHIPVLLKEVLTHLDPRENQNFVDCTVGEGGHAFEILKHTAPGGKVLGIDRDGEALRKLELEKDRQGGQMAERLTLVQGNFTRLGAIIRKEGLEPVQGVLFDLGLSSWQLEESGRGFSFLRDEPLDMRFDPISAPPSPTAAEILKRYPLQELENVLRRYGEERFAGRIARAIVKVRKTKAPVRTKTLAQLIASVVPNFGRTKIHPATRTFQALRIAVNDELANLQQGLEKALEALTPGGKIVCIAFHSLEDRIVKNFFRDRAKRGQLILLTCKPVTPTLSEKNKNLRSRSAKLRSAMKR